MAASKKRSLSDLHHPDTASYKQDSDETYRIMVLRFDETEDQVDQHFLQTALELGINTPQEAKTTLDLITSNVATLGIDPTISEHF